MTVTVLISLLLLCALFQPVGRRMCCAVFALAVGVHDVLFGALDGSTYYLVAAVFDYAVVFILMTVACSWLSVSLMVVSTVSIAANLYGWTLWYSDAAPDPYNLAYVGIYSAAIFLMLGGDYVLERVVRFGLRVGFRVYAHNCFPAVEGICKEEKH